MYVRLHVTQTLPHSCASEESLFEFSYIGILVFLPSLYFSSRTRPNKEGEKRQLQSHPFIHFFGRLIFDGKENLTKGQVVSFYLLFYFFNLFTRKF